MNMFLNKPKKTIGLDIGSQFIKLLAVEKLQNNFIINNFIIEKRQGNDTESLKNQIKKFDLGKDPINISVSGPNVVIRYLPFTKMSVDELKQSLSFEVEKHIPFPINEVNLDSFILKELPDKKMLVLVVAAKKTIIEDKIKLFKDLNLNLNSVDVDSMALVNAFNFLNKDANKDVVALLNIGATISSLNIVYEAKPSFTRDLMIGGNIFTKSISEKFNLSLEQAEELKCNPGNKADELIPCLDAGLASLFSEIRTSFDYFENQEHMPIKKIFVSGGSVGLTGLIGYLQNSLGVAVSLWGNMDTLKLKEGLDVEGFKLHKDYFLPCLGLAIRGL